YNTAHFSQGLCKHWFALGRQCFVLHWGRLHCGRVLTLSEKQLILTEAGLKRIERELHELQTVRRHEVADHIRAAKALGDVAENPEYETAKTEQAFVEGRILELKNILNIAHIVDELAAPTDEVGIGSVVRVRDLETEDEWDYTIVGSVEADPLE